MAARDKGSRRKWIWILMATLVVSAGCVREEQVEGGGEGGGEPATQRLSVATGTTGGVYVIYGGGLADLMTDELEGVEATAEVTSASVDNMLLIADESSDVAFTLADTAADGVEGEAAFDEQVPAQALANLYVNYTQVGTIAGTGIETIDDLRNKTVSLGSPNSGTEVIALRILEAAGIDPDEDIGREQLDVEQSVQALRDGSIDAFFWSGGLPTGAVTDLASTDDLVLVPTDQYTEDLASQYGPFYSATAIPADSYPGLEEDVPTIGVPNYLVVNESMEEDLAFEITELLFEHKSDLVKVHPEAKNLDLETATETTPLELHPGAERYYEQAQGG
ncbi:MAG: TAXI family TRAP transporter solute-binding subunit [Actinomycetota bacterium]